jgi:hypothetical protein
MVSNKEINKKLREKRIKGYLHTKNGIEPLYNDSTILKELERKPDNSFFSNYINYITASMFIIAVIIAIILTFLLFKGILPNYLNSIYILLGALMVFSIDMILNKKLNKEKENKKKIRISFVLRSNFATNIWICNKNLSLLSNDIEERDLELLNMGLFEIISFSILEVDFSPNFVEGIFIIKDFTYEINKLIKERELLLKQFPTTFSLYKKLNENDETLINLTYLNNRLIKYLKRLRTETTGWMNTFKD